MAEPLATDTRLLHTHVLEGCRPIPLASYLKALGILRLVTEQADQSARGWWNDDRFVLRSRLDRNALLRFFLQDYRPTPVIAPWNGGSGFYPKDNTDGINPLGASDTPRLAAFKEAIALGRDLVRKRRLNERPTDAAKSGLIAALRGQGAAALVDWIDAAIALTLDRTAYPPLLGTGGNDGRLDFSNNFMQRLTELIEPSSGAFRPSAGPALEGSLFGVPTAGLAGAAIGQFSPGAAGGPNSTIGTEGSSQINRWDFVLMIEGAMVFAGGVSRRLESTDANTLSYPFTVRAAAAGFGTASLDEQGDSRGELWVPLWERPTSLVEIWALFREGRLSVGVKPARDGLDAARAVASLGADRRVAAFERYGFVKRQGLAFLAAPLGRRIVAPNPRGELLSELDAGGGQGWFQSVRRAMNGDGATAGYRAAAHGLEESVFALLDRPQDIRAVQQVLVDVGAVARAVAVRDKLRDEVRPPPVLSGAWLEAADDKSAEFQVALALAGLHRMSAHFGPLAPGRRVWVDKDGLGTAKMLAVWGEGSLKDNLRAVMQRRLLNDAAEAFLGGRFKAGSGDIAAFLDEGRFDDRRTMELLLGLVWVTPQHLAQDKHRPPALPFAYAAIKPLFTSAKILADARQRQLTQGRGDDNESAFGDSARAEADGAADQPTDPAVPAFEAPDRLQLRMPPDLPALLAAGRVSDAIRVAQRRARASGLATPFLDDRQQGPDFAYPPGFGRRLLAALLIPVHAGVVRACLEQAYPTRPGE